MEARPEPGRGGQAEGRGHRDEVGDDVARKGRARRFREARELKQGFDDGLFSEGSGTLADLDDDAASADDEDDWDEDEHDDEWDEEDPLKIDERRNAS
jgi:hypothetical protein